jgi:hypothetical protein
VIENWFELVIGVLVLISPWVFGFANIPLAEWVDVLCGTALILINVWVIYGKDPAAETSSMLETAAIQKPKRVRRKSVDVDGALAPAHASLSAPVVQIVKNRKIKKVEQSLINS